MARAPMTTAKKLREQAARCRAKTTDIGPREEAGSLQILETLAVIADALADEREGK